MVPFIIRSGVMISVHLRLPGQEVTCTEYLVMCLFPSKLDKATKFKCVQRARQIHFRKYTEPSLDGTVYSAARGTEGGFAGKNSFFFSVGFMRIKIGFICQISYEGRKTVVSVGMLKRILCFIAAGIRQEMHCV